MKQVSRFQFLVAQKCTFLETKGTKVVKMVSVAHALPAALPSCCSSAYRQTSDTDARKLSRLKYSYQGEISISNKFLVPVSRGSKMYVSGNSGNVHATTQGLPASLPSYCSSASRLATDTDPRKLSRLECKKVSD